MAKRTQVIVPNPINILTLVNDSILAARRAGNDVSIALPSLRKRARMMVNEEGTLRVNVDVPEKKETFIR